MNRQRSGFGLYAAFMVIIVLAMFYITGKISAGSSPSQQKFETAVKDGKVTSAQIVQNKEVPYPRKHPATDPGKLVFWAH